MRFIQVILQKSAPEDKAGIAFQMNNTDGMIVISSIAEGGLFQQCAGSYAKTGMRVLRIGSTTIVDGMDAVACVKLIQEAKGDIPILLVDGSTKDVKADLIHVSTTNKTEDGKVKLAFQGEPNRIQVTRVLEGSPFEDTELQAGDTLFSVNNLSLENMDVSQVRDILGQAKDPLTVISGIVPVNPTNTLAKMYGDTPPGVPEGGQWGTVKYVGNNTMTTACICCLVVGCFALCILACPVDEKDAYKVNGKVYDADGKPTPPDSNKSFVPKRQVMTR